MKAGTDFVGGKHDPVVLHVVAAEMDAQASISGNDVKNQDYQSEQIVLELQQIRVMQEQQTEVLCILIGICAGLLVGAIFSVWLSKVWR